MRVLSLLLLLLSFQIKAQNVMDLLLRNEPNGETIKYYSNGNVRDHFTKRYNHVVGLVYEYHRNGKLKALNKIENERFVDTSYYYDKKGRLGAIDVFRNDTLLYSEIKFFHGNDSCLSFNRYYLDGLGFTFSYNNIKYRSRFGYDQIILNRFKLSAIDSCRNDEYWYFKNGRIFTEVHRMGPKRIGEKKEFFSDGKPCSIKRYVDGVKDGQQWFYNEKGFRKCKYFVKGKRMRNQE